MKKYILLMLALPITLAFGQKAEVGLANGRLYTDIKIPLVINVNSNSPGDITVTTDNGTIVKEANQYFVQPKNVGITTITVSQNSKVISQSSFPTSPLPEPDIKVGNSRNGDSVNVAKFKVQLGPRAELVDMVYDVQFEILSYDIAIQTSGDEQFTNFTNNGQKYNDAAAAAVQKIKSGDKVMISNVKVKTPSGSIRTLTNGVTITVI